MASSRATSVAQYLAELPPERRQVVAAVRDVVNRHLPMGYEEGMAYGMIGWSIPLARYPGTYNGQPLMYLALAAQKGAYSFYTMCAYADPATAKWVRDEYAKAGLRLDMGKSCIRFKDLGGLPMPVVKRLAALLSVDDYLAYYERSQAASKRGRHGAGAKAAKPAQAKHAAKPAGKLAAKAAPRRAAKQAAKKK